MRPIQGVIPSSPSKKSTLFSSQFFYYSRLPPDPRPSHKRSPYRTRTIALVAVVLVVLTIALGVGLGLGWKTRNRDGQSHDGFEDVGFSMVQPWNNPSEFLLDRSFEVKAGPPMTRVYDWTITQQTIAPDGLERSMLLVNGMFPGPLVEANAGDRIVVKVTNKLASGTAIHWHGMYQNGTNWMDGTTGITQCPIPPGQSFTYNFTVSNQWGTFWWHAHASSQYVDGIVGPLVVHSPEEPQLGQYDEDIIMMISDYYHTDSKTLVSWYLSPESEGSEPVPDNGLINGRNPFDCSKDSSAHFPTGNRCDPGAPHAHFSFQKGLRYRIRIINSGAFAAFHFSIDNHRLTVIEVDGVDVQPVEVERIPIHVAQRYSALVDANQTVGNYWVRADMNTNCFNDPNPALDPSVRAIIHYDGAPLTTTVHGADKEEGMAGQDWASSSWSPRCKDLSSDMLKPWLVRDAPPADLQLQLSMSFQTITQSVVSLGYVNKTSWEPLRGDATLFQAHQGVSTFDNSQLMVTFNRSMTVELVIINYDEGDHPFHLHGHTFYVLAIGSGGYMFDLSPPLQTKNPLRRDTVTIPAFGHAVIRFVTDNPGIWAFHCHIHWHMEAGLLVQFLSQPDAIQAFNIPEELKAMCK